MLRHPSLSPLVPHALPPAGADTIMTTDSATPAITYLSGHVGPGPASTCSPEQVAAFLRDRKLLGAVGHDRPDALAVAVDARPVLLCLAATDDGRVLVSTASGPQPGPALGAVARELAAATRCDVDIAEVFEAGAPPAGEGDEEPGLVWVDLPETEALPDVLVCRTGSDVLPLLARDLSSPLQAVRVGEHLVVRAVEPNADLHKHGWRAGEGPVIALSGFGGDRYVSVLVGRGVLPGQATLTRLPMLLPVFAADEVAPATVPLLDELADPHLHPDSQLSLLLAQAPYARLDARTVAAAVQSDDGPDWFAGVLTALGVPSEVVTIAAGAAEGGDLPDATEVVPAGFWAAVRSSMRLSEQDALDETIRRGPLLRFHAASLRNPWIVLSTVIPELVVGVPALTWALGSTERPWWLVGIGVVAALLIVDAVADLVLMAVRLRRRRQR